MVPGSGLEEAMQTSALRRASATPPAIPSALANSEASSKPSPIGSTSGERLARGRRFGEAAAHYRRGLVTPLAAVLLVTALPLAVANWWSRWSANRTIEWVTKPAVTVLIALAAVAVDPRHEAMRWWFVAAYVGCLAGDVFLMLPRERFVPGLASFLAAHLLFVAGFVAGGLDDTSTGIGMVVVAVLVLASVGRCVLGGARRSDPGLAAPVTAYLLVITGMAVVAGFHGDGWGIAGALTFVLSDSLLGWGKFVAPVRHGSVAVMATYHLALVGLLLSLV
jgi:uncharacterized membrane protein YhhN